MLASLVLMINTDTLTHSEIGNSQFYATSGLIQMSLKMECHSKWNDTQNGMKLKMECNSKWIVTQNGLSLKMECHSKWNATQNGMSLKMEYHSN